MSRSPELAALERLRSGLIVSCQAVEGSPFRRQDFMAAMATAAASAGAVGIRAAGISDVAAIRAAVQLPIIGLTKARHPDSDVVITATTAEAAAIAAAGADLIAIDATQRPRPGGGTVTELIRFIHRELGLPVVADVDSVAAALAAIADGADSVATTLSGYTGGTVPEAPDLELVERLVAATRTPVIAEGRFGRPGVVRDALLVGAFAVVVGTAITNPAAITARFVSATVIDPSMLERQRLR